MKFDTTTSKITSIFRYFEAKYGEIGSYSNFRHFCIKNNLVKEKKKSIPRPSNYLYNNSTYWLMSPWDFSNLDNIARNFRFSNNGSWFYSQASTSYGVRGVLNLIPETTVTGTGSELDQFIVQ